jgi:superfamily II DNA/RNA helicase
VAALLAVGIERSFAIQEYALPIALRGTDLIGQAPTGTGKTLGFGVPLLDRLVAPAEGADGMPQALVVVPTRELGLQVARDLATAGKTRGIRVLPVYGGVAYEPQIEALKRGVEIIVGTPGRLLDLSRPAKGKKEPYLRLDSVKALVLDEADRMLDLGFLDDVEKILAMLPVERQTMLFSATMPDPIVTLARRFLRHPVTIHARHDAATAASPLTKQVVYRTHPLNKVEVLARILQAEGRGLTMIFTRTKRQADRVCEDLDFRGFAVAAVHGDLGQGARERALRAFRNGKIDVLVATDVAARGLDVSGVTHVINYDCPEDPGHVHPPHRPHRPGRRHRRRGDVRGLGGHAPLADHRQDAGAGQPGAAGDLPHLSVPVHRPGHPGRCQRHPAVRPAQPGRPGRRGRGGPGRRSLAGRYPAPGSHPAGPGRRRVAVRPGYHRQRRAGRAPRADPPPAPGHRA